MFWNLKKEGEKNDDLYLFYIFFLIRFGVCIYFFRVYEYNICMLYNEGK